MKRIFLFIFALQVSVFASSLLAADVVTVTLSDGIENAAVKAKMERAISNILTEANRAQAAGREINYASLGLNASVAGSISALWDNSPFVCIDDEIVEHCLTTGTGYQVRNIPLMLRPAMPGDVEKDEEYQEAVVSFDKQGNVVSFYLAISMNLYMQVIRGNKDVVDARRRQLILDYVEQFRTSYNKRDIKFLEQVFSDDALIITGTVIKQTKDGIRLPDKIVYKKQSKQQYLNNLRSAFNRGKNIHVTFDEIEVARHGSNPDFYGVTLHQGWTQVGYHDDGYVFLLWDFTNESSPKIHVRTWQPDAYDKTGKGSTRIPKEEIFCLDDFDI